MTYNILHNDKLIALMSECTINYKILPDAFSPFMNSSLVSMLSWLLSNLRNRSLTLSFCWSTHPLNLFLHASKLNDL